MRIKSFLLSSFFFFTFILSAQLEAKDISLFQFKYHGPAEKSHLAQILNDTVLAELSGNFQVRLLSKHLSSGEMQNTGLKTYKSDVLLSANFNWLGNQGFLLLYWLDRSGQSSYKINYKKIEYSREGQLIKVTKKSLLDLVQEIRDPIVEVPVVKTKEPVKRPVFKKIQKPKIEKIEEAETKKFKSSLKPVLDQTSQFSSQRLPFAVNSMLVADLDSDGRSEIILASDHDIYVYREQAGVLKRITRYSGRSIDFYLKVAVYQKPGSQQKYLIVNNIKNQSAASMLMQFSNDGLQIVLPRIPYLLRALKIDGVQKLIVEAFSTREKIKHQLYEAELNSKKIKIIRKLKFPYSVGIFDFSLTEEKDGSSVLVSLKDRGVLQIWRKNSNSSYQKQWMSSEVFGGSMVQKKLDIRATLGTLQSEYYSRSMTPVIDPQNPTLVSLIKNGALLHKRLGRGFLMSTGQVKLMRLSDLGLSELWSSQKIEGGIADLQTELQGKNLVIYVAVRLKSAGLLASSKNSNSIFMKYFIQL